MKNLIIIFFTTILLTGCTGMKIEDFNNTSPEFIPQEYFNGKLRAYGLVKDRSGKITRTFKGTMIGSWDKDGNGQDKKFIATADDIVGPSAMIANGNTVMLDYVMRVPYNDSTIDISVKDWLHLQEDGVIINHSKMKKFGFVVGELVITIIKD